MKKCIVLFLLSASLALAQSKTSGPVLLQPNMTAVFTLNNATSKVTLVLTGPSDRWFGIGIGVSSGFSMGAGDALVYTTSLSDCRFAGTFGPPADTSQDWALVSDDALGMVRTLVYTRDLTNSDTAGSDFQMPYATTNSFSVVGVRASSATTTLGGHGGSASAGYATATFTTLGVEDFSLNASSVAPNPTTGNFTINTKTALSEINVYSHVGAFVKTIKVNNATSSEVSVDGLSKGVYLLELKNSTDKSWKKIIVE